MRNTVKLARAWAAVFVLPMALAGCGSLLSSAGPSRYAISSSADSQGYTLIDLTADTIGPYMRPGEHPVESTVALPSVPEVRLVPGDVLRVMVADSAEVGSLFASLASGGTVF